MLNEEITLERDCPAVLIPAGDKTVLPAGTTVFVTQALGGAITVRTASGLFQIAANDSDALGKGKETLADETPSAEPFSEELVWKTLKSCYDPEIPINIVDLGLIYDMAVENKDDGARHVAVKMTLTAQGCGMGPTIANDARQKILQLPEVESAEVDIVWDPVWTPQMISEEGRKKLGIT